MKRRKTVLMLLIAGAITLLSFLLVALNEAGPWLVTNDPEPASLEMLFTFGGEIDHFSYSKSIMRRHPETFWVLSVGNFPVFDTITFAQIVHRNVAIEGFDTSNIIVNDTCTSTGAEITVLYALIEQALGRQSPVAPDSSHNADRYWYEQLVSLHRHFQTHPPRDSTLTIGVVSSPFHMRRISLLLRRFTKELPVRIYLLPTGNDKTLRERMRRIRWWSRESDASFVISEYIKLVYYFTIRGKVPVTP